MSLGCAGAARTPDPSATRIVHEENISEAEHVQLAEQSKQSPRSHISIPIVSTCELPVATRIPLSSMRTYGEYARMGGIPLGLDIFSPRDAGPHPMVLLIHGGGWRAGERAHVHEMAMMLADAGFVSVAVDYRKTERPGYRFPGAIADLRCAIRFLRQNAQALDADPARIGAVGFSAGGHLAALLATASDIDALDDSCPHTGSARIQAAVSYYGVHDLTRRGDFVPRARRLISQMLEGREPARARLASTMSTPMIRRSCLSMVRQIGGAHRAIRTDGSSLEASRIQHRLVRVPDGTRLYLAYRDPGVRLNMHCDRILALTRKRTSRFRFLRQKVMLAP